MEVVDLEPEHEDLFLCCLKPYDAEFATGVRRKVRWYESFRGHGLGAKMAIDDDGQVAGMIQYVPVEHAPHVEGAEGVWVILCIWVHGYPQGVGDRRGRGLGPALLTAAEEDMAARGALGIAAWGITQPVWMNVPWFESNGYRRVEDRGWYALAFKPLEEGIAAPRWVQERKRPKAIPGKVRVSAFEPQWCPAGNLILEWARAASDEMGDLVVFEEFDTSDPRVAAEWGISTGLFVDGEEMAIRGDETYQKVRDHIVGAFERLND
jgi:GNAT superfamily N-acetyltransferase